MAKSQIFILVALFLLLNSDIAFAFDPYKVDNATKEIWCTNQKATCISICQDSGYGGVIVNECNVETLAYDCLCENNVRPNSTQYTQTIPYFECTYDVKDCTDKCPAADQGCIDGCQKNCTATNPKSYSAVPTPPPTSTQTSTSATTSTTKGSILDAAATLPAPTINGSFAILLTLFFIFFARM
ncbi:hypothetical protein Glove_495g31 [Diversispora epigaea]|uniref:DUF7707 domain-containing protein n=1 Tax=Diversispora epigaea TaxID=1348612 RepID=A0A397GM67_9GLOM|nr:hypothetical protein Glove_495g31 [Diversispora epigaea]